jgi:hypothetical protein
MASLALVVVAAVVGAGCGATSDGRTLRPPQTDQTTTTRAEVADTASTGQGSAGGAGPRQRATAQPAEPFTLSSPAITEGGEVPVRYTCRGEDVSPPLRWTGTPVGTVEIALVVRDVDAEGFVHWVVAGLPPDLDGLAEAAVPAGAVEATNDFGRPGWSGPCPPAGEHAYELRIYALARPSGVAAGESGPGAAAKVGAAPATASAVLSASATAA